MPEMLEAFDGNARRAELALSAFGEGLASTWRALADEEAFGTLAAKAGEVAAVATACRAHAAAAAAAELREAASGRRRGWRRATAAACDAG